MTLADAIVLNAFLVFDASVWSRVLIEIWRLA